MKTLRQLSRSLCTKWRCFDQQECGWDYNGLLDSEGRRTFGDNGLHICPTLVSNPVEGLVTGYNEVGADAAGRQMTMETTTLTAQETWLKWIQVFHMVDFITLEAPTYTTFKTTIFYSRFERKNVSIFIKYDITDDHRMYLIYTIIDSLLRMMVLHHQLIIQITILVQLIVITVM